MLTSGSNLYVQYFNFCFCYFDNKSVQITFAIHVCLQAENCPEPLEIYRYMQAQGIGVTQTSFYIAWSEEYENQGNCRKADLVYQEGFKKSAEPHDKLQQFHK